MMTIESKNFLVLITIIAAISTLLLCTLSDDSFRDPRNLDLVISVKEKEKGVSYRVNEDVEFKVTVISPNLVKKIEVDFDEKGKTEVKEIKTDSSTDEEIGFTYKYTETGKKNVLFTVYYRDSEKSKGIFSRIVIGPTPKIMNDGELVTTEEILSLKLLDI